MKKILSTFLLSAMLVLVLGGCEGDAGPKGKQGIQGERGEQGIQGERGIASVNEIERLERRVESLTDEVRWLHMCMVTGNRQWVTTFESIKHYCELYPDYALGSPYRSNDAFKEWKGKDYPFP